MWINSAVTGHYKPVGDLAEADCLIGHSFSTVTHESSVNNALARFALQIADDRPIIADRTFVDAFPEEIDVAHIVEGPVANYIGGGVGTWGTLVEAKEYMKETRLVRPVMVAQAYHIGRVVLQAKKLGMEAVVPEGLPAGFDADSSKLHTRSRSWWIPREIVGSLALKIEGRL